MPYTRLPLADFMAKYTAFTTLTEPSYAAWATDAEMDITDRRDRGDIVQIGHVQRYSLR